MRKLIIILSMVASVGLQAAQNLDSARANISAVKEDSQFNEFIVKYRVGSIERADKNALQDYLDGVSNVTGRSISYLRTLATGADLIRIRETLDRSASLDLMEAILDNADVVYVEPNDLQQPQLVPDDDEYDAQWHFFPSEDEDGALNLEDAWEIATGTGVRVAVLDTGVTDHADLADNLVGGYDFIASPATARDGGARDADPQDEGNWVDDGDCGVGDPAQDRDSVWHGTHVMGTVAALTDNAQGVAGVAHDASVVPIRVLGRCGGTIADISDAIVWAGEGP